MSDDATLLDRERLDGLLRELAEPLHRQGVAARLFVVGGAAIVLARPRERLTRAVEARVPPRLLAAKVAFFVCEALADECQRFSRRLMPALPEADPPSGAGCSRAFRSRSPTEDQRSRKAL